MEPLPLCVSNSGGCVDASGQPCQGGCLVDCTNGGSCPKGLACTSVNAGYKACLGPSSTGSIAACSSVSNAQSCGTNFVCGVSGNMPGPAAAPNPNTLPDGTCPINTDLQRISGCAGTVCYYCACLIGYTGVLCSNGTSCNTDNCTGQLWGCKPTAPPAPPGCTGTTSGFSGTCNCVNGKTVTFACGGSGASCEQLCEQTQ